ncbi:MAG: nucleotidyltransferase family protein [Nitrospirota bacterium]|nr:nucleotidyltransferase family protein [Nitrospirota bacterium]
MSVTRAMLLAAGRGERLRPLTDRVPKPLIPLGGQPMVFRVLTRLAAAGIRQVHINTHHLGAQLPEAIGDGSRWGVRVVWHHEAEILGTGGGLANALNESPELADAPVLMINSDILVDADLNALIATHAAHPSGEPLATLVLRPDPAAEHYGVIATDDAGRIRRFLTTDTGGATREYMFTGIQIIAPRLLKPLAERRGPFAITEPYMQALAAGETLMGHIHTGYWSDLGTPERLMQAEADLTAGKLDAPPFPAA